MKIEAGSVAEYWDAVPDDWRRERMNSIRAAILREAPEVNESLAYGMLRYGWNEEQIVCHLACQVRHVGLYLGDVAALDPSGKWSAGLDIGRGCVRVRKRDDMAQIEGLLSAKIARRRAEYQP